MVVVVFSTCSTVLWMSLSWRFGSGRGVASGGTRKNIVGYAAMGMGAPRGS